MKLLQTIKKGDKMKNLRITLVAMAFLSFFVFGCKHEVCEAKCLDTNEIKLGLYTTIICAEKLKMDFSKGNIETKIQHIKNCVRKELQSHGIDYDAEYTYLHNWDETYCKKINDFYK
jgi:hypothetical protein